MCTPGEKEDAFSEWVRGLLGQGLHSHQKACVENIWLTDTYSVFKTYFYYSELLVGVWVRACKCRCQWRPRRQMAVSCQVWLLRCGTDLRSSARVSALNCRGSSPAQHFTSLRKKKATNSLQQVDMEQKSWTLSSDAPHAFTQ